MIFDGHSDIFTDVTVKRLEGETHVLDRFHRDKLKKGQVEGSIFVIWVDPPYDKDYVGRTNQIEEAITAEMKETEDFVIVHNFREMEEAKAKGQFYIFIGIEGLAAIGDDVSKIDHYYDFGARHAMLTWNEENLLGTGVQGDVNRGLTKAGRQAVRKIQDNHMIMDVSHLNEKSFWDVMDVTTAPIIASHSNAKAICPAARNLTDDQLRAIRDTGGLVGINSFNLFVDSDMKKQTVENLLRHIIYISEKIGTEYLGFGFDFFEFLSPDKMASYSHQATSFTTGLEDCTTVPHLLELMKKAGFSQGELEAISLGNWHRLIQKTIG